MGPGSVIRRMGPGSESVVRRRLALGPGITTESDRARAVTGHVTPDVTVTRTDTVTVTCESRRSHESLRLTDSVRRHQAAGGWPAGTVTRDGVLRLRAGPAPAWSRDCHQAPG